MLRHPETKEPFYKQPPTKIGKTRVDYLEASLTTFRDKYWVTLIPLDENDDRIWEFCLYDGKIIQTK